MIGQASPASVKPGQIKPKRRAATCGGPGLHHAQGQTRPVNGQNFSIFRRHINRFDTAFPTFTIDNQQPVVANRNNEASSIFIIGKGAVDGTHTITLDIIATPDKSNNQQQRSEEAKISHPSYELNFERKKSPLNHMLSGPVQLVT